VFGCFYDLYTTLSKHYAFMQVRTPLPGTLSGFHRSFASVRMRGTTSLRQRACGIGPPAITGSMHGPLAVRFLPD
jgi:hypothetical protein